MKKDSIIDSKSNSIKGKKFMKKQEEKLDINDYCRNAGIILILLGLAHFILSEFLLAPFGIILIILGIISLLVRRKEMFLVFGLLLIYVGISNFLVIFYEFSMFWLIFSILQVSWGISELVNFSKFKLSKKSNAWGIAGFISALFSFIIVWLDIFTALPFAILSIVFFAKQIKIRKSGLATAGLVIGIISLVIITLTLMVLISEFY